MLMIGTTSALAATLTVGRGAGFATRAAATLSRWARI
jgi:hypothetical protein